MGYDMYWTAPKPEDTEKAARLREQWRELLKADPDQQDAATIETVRRELDKAETNYFRLNIWGMVTCRDLMYRFGMLMVDYEMPESPERPEVDEEAFDAWLYDDVVPEGGVPESWTAYRKAGEDSLAAHPEKVEGICVHKLGSNDGWVVTPEECRAALTKWREVCDTNGWPYDIVVRSESGDDEDGATKRELVEWWPEWLAYLAGAVDNGGFSVY
jgi:hypothetical protein